jgi:hypothetical protein
VILADFYCLRRYAISITISFHFIFYYFGFVCCFFGFLFFSFVLSLFLFIAWKRASFHRRIEEESSDGSEGKR